MKPGLVQAVDVDPLPIARVVGDGHVMPCSVVDRRVRGDPLLVDADVSHLVDPRADGEVLRAAGKGAVVLAQDGLAGSGCFDPGGDGERGVGVQIGHAVVDDHFITVAVEEHGAGPGDDAVGHVALQQRIAEHVAVHDRPAGAAVGCDSEGHRIELPMSDQIGLRRGAKNCHP